MYSKSTIFLMLSWVFLIYACRNSPSASEAVAIFEAIKQEYAPDKRVAIFDIELASKARHLTLKGKSNLPEAKADLIRKLTAAGFEVTDEIKQLPADDLKGKAYGIVNVSVCNIRSQPGHSQELATQALLGTPIRIYEKKDAWFRIQTPDGYLGWLDNGGFQQISENNYKEWISAPKIIYNRDFGFAYEAPDKESQKVSNLVTGNTLKSIGMEGDFIKVQYPDGRVGFVHEEEISNFDSWLASRTPDVANILTTAQTFLGRPYLWGGTSGNGMDCSGFTKMVFYLNGVQLARDASQQVHTGHAVETDTTLKNLLPSDFLFFGRYTDEGKERITHVGIYMGQGKMIHASGDGGVMIESLIRGAKDFNEKRLKSFIRAKRMLTSLGENGVELLAESPFYNISEL